MHSGVELINNIADANTHEFDTSITVGYTTSPPTQTYSVLKF